jgi:hypothetical protein
MFVFNPPFVKSLVGTDIEALFRWRCLSNGFSAAAMA